MSKRNRNKPVKNVIRCNKCRKILDVKPCRSFNLDTADITLSEYLDNKLFKHTCPECGTNHIFVYNTIFHDVKNRIMVELNPEHKNLNIEEILLSDVLGEYTLRVERNNIEFIERIRIIEDGFDDILFTIFKNAIRIKLSTTGTKVGHIEYIGRDIAYLKFNIFNNGNITNTVKVPIGEFVSFTSKVKPSSESGLIESGRILEVKSLLNSDYAKECLAVALNITSNKQ